MGIHAELLEWMQALPLPVGFAVCELGDQFVTQGKGAPYLARRWYEQRGCDVYICIDANGENGALVRDLNRPLDEAALAGRFDLVTDFGTGEHVFNQLEVWRALHNLAKPRGFIIFDRPSQGYPGHCFYLIHWNLISALAHANNYEVLRLEEARTSRGIMLRGILRKREPGLPFLMPQQGRYVPDLKIEMAEQGVPDWKNAELRRSNVSGRPHKRP